MEVRYSSREAQIKSLFKMLFNFSLQIAELISTTVHFRLHNFHALNAAASK
jgi:hypothetical protein